MKNRIFVILAAAFALHLSVAQANAAGQPPAIGENSGDDPARPFLLPTDASESEIQAAVRSLVEGSEAGVAAPGFACRDQVCLQHVTVGFAHREVGK